MKALSRVILYLVLALVCYVLALAFKSTGLFFAVFLIGGIALELLFWRSLLFGFRRQTQE